MSTFKKKAKISILLGSIAVMFFSMGFITRTLSPNDEYFEISKNLDIFGKLYREVHSFYVDDVDPNKFMRVGVDAMLSSLDPYTNFISASEIEDYRFMSTGQYGGIGAIVGTYDGRVLISEPYEGYPADEAGLRAGDEIIKVGETVVKDQPQLDVRELLRGQAGTDVKITLVRDKETFEKDVTRKDIKIDNVPFWDLVNKDIGYLALTGFTQDAALEVKTAITDLKKKNPELKGIIVDLRDNPGGLLFEAIGISNLFLPTGELIVETRGKIEGSLQTYTAQKPPLDLNIPVAVLINRRSASASEIVSGVMQDLDRGVVLGQRSFGKGLVQTSRRLSYNTQMKITTAKYYTPSGRCIQALDYSHRNEDGSVGTVPDSLKKEFKTKNGRSVFDGGGINPDVLIDLPSYHTITRELLRQSLVFDFATFFRNKHDSILSARKFEVTDAIYKEFVDFVKGQDFSYETKTEKELTRLKEMLEEESYFDNLKPELGALTTKINKEKENDLYAFQEEISEVLKIELVLRYYYRKGQFESSFTEDPEIVQAVKVLTNPAKYKSILEGN